MNPGGINYEDKLLIESNRTLKSYYDDYRQRSLEEFQNMKETKVYDNVSVHGK